MKNNTKQITSTRGQGLVRIFWLLWAFNGLLTLAILPAGCQSVTYSRSEEAKYFKPTIGVMAFENRAPVIEKWNLGNDMADQLSDRLLQTRRYVVLDRAKATAMSRNISADRTSRNKTTPTSAPTEVRYLIKGTITDFGAVKTVKEIWPLTTLGVMKEPSHRTVAAMIYVIDVQTGQIVASRNIEAQFEEEKPLPNEYQGIAFGSYAFYHMPLGKATAEVLDQAVREIAHAIEEQAYQPKIASVVGNRIVINGGRDRRIKVASEYVVRPSPASVVDPDTGHVLGHVTGDIIGRIQITQVCDRYAVAKVLDGYGFEPGQTLFPAQQKGLYQPVALSNY